MRGPQRGALIFGTITLSLAVNGLLGGRIGVVSRSVDVTFSPRSGAFAIWSAIYPLLCLHAASQWRTQTASESTASESTLDVSAMLLSASLVAAALWVPLFVRNELWAVVSAAVALHAGFACAYVALLVLPRATTPVEWTMAQLPLGIFAGWLLVASFLTTCIALKMRGWSLPEWLPLVAAIGGAIAAIAARSPEFAAAQVWAFAWSPGAWSGMSRTIASVGFAGALTRVVSNI